MATTPSQADASELIRRLRQGDRRALARSLTWVATGQDADMLAAALANGDDERKEPLVIAFTGSGGVGKSSLLGAVTTLLAERGERIGVLACDPESPLTGGALLGDRCRIVSSTTSDHVFVRSLSTASGQQGIASRMEPMLRLMRAFGFDRVFVETVGTGQGDTAVRLLADVVVLVLQPQAGDSLQWEKAGLMEVADIVVVNKADLPGADRTAADVLEQWQLSDGRSVAEVVTTSVAKYEGIADLCRVIDDVCRRQKPGSTSRALTR